MRSNFDLDIFLARVRGLLWCIRRYPFDVGVNVCVTEEVNSTYPEYRAVQVDARRILNNGEVRILEVFYRKEEDVKKSKKG